jgi:shikimate kinase
VPWGRVAFRNVQRGSVGNVSPDHGPVTDPPNAPDPRTRPILLVGMMGSGKTTVGLSLAERTGWRFVDNDELVERRTGRTARELLKAGVQPLRAAEAQALRDGLEEPPPVIVGVAAGVVMDPDIRTAMRERGIVVWLRATPETLARRVLAVLDEETGKHRPWLGGGPDAALAWLREQSRRRLPLFESVASVIVDVDRADGSDRTTDEIVDEVAARLLGTLETSAG